jgi:hypothetical protein
LVQSWNGTSWSLLATPTLTSYTNELDGISCTSASDCVAVGYAQPQSGTGPTTLTEVWNGTSWSLVTSPDPGSALNFLYGVSCAGSDDCTAVGYYNNGAGDDTLVASWNGTVWTNVASPNLGAVNILNGVSCHDSDTCTSGGLYDLGGPDMTLVETGRTPA